ncbi:hypothetical protein BRADI_4g11294v3, partial [Brachypodium distachyon]
MASVSAVALLKATTLLAVLAILLLPSSARCRSRAPAPAPAPGPLPPAPTGVRCSDCPAYCAGAAKGLCGRYCGDRQPPPGCDDCRSAVLQGCTACCGAGGGCSNGTVGGRDCGTCDYCGGTGGCGGVVESRCQGACTVNLRACEDCRAVEERRCSASCNSNCV